MQITAMSSAVVGMRRASALLDTAAAQVADETVGAVSGDALSTAAPPGVDDGLITAVPNLIMASALFKSSAFVARVAREAYQSETDWPPSAA